MRAWYVLRKELQGLTGYALMCVALTTGSTLSWAMLAEHPDMLPMRIASLNEQAGDTAFFTLILAIILGANILQTERDEGTLRYLDTLPISRSQVFVAKVGAAWVILALMVCLPPATSMVVATWAPTPLDPSWHLHLFAQVTALAWLQGAVLLGYALALSYLRRAGWMLLLSWLLIVGALRQSLPAFEVLDPGVITDWHLNGRHLDLKSTAIMVQASLALLGYGIAFALFRGSGERVLSKLENFSTSAWTRIATRIASAIFALFALIMLLVLVQLKQSQADDEDDLPDSVIATHSYRIGCDQAQRDDAITLAREADATYAEVAQMLQLPPVAASPLLMDVRGMGNARHLAGSYSLATIRMSADGSVDTLAHETVHALLYRASPAFVTNHGASFRVWNEGLADWVEEHRHSTHNETALDLAAFYVRRHDLSVDNVLSASTLQSRLGNEAIYPLGHALVDAFVQLAGPTGPAQLLASLADPDRAALSDDDGALSDLLQRSNANVDQVLDVLLGQLDDRHIDPWLALPAPVVSTTGVPDSIVVTTAQAAPTGMELRARARPDSSTKPAEYASATRNDDGVWEIARSSRMRTHTDLQVGWFDSEQQTMLWWPWYRVEIIEPDEDDTEADEDDTDTDPFDTAEQPPSLQGVKEQKEVTHGPPSGGCAG